MTQKTGDKKVARLVQEVVAEQTGKKASLNFCVHLAQEHEAQHPETMPAERRALLVFEANKERFR